jgi:hypothetical protein
MFLLHGDGLPTFSGGKCWGRADRPADGSLVPLRAILTVAVSSSLTGGKESEERPAAWRLNACSGIWITSVLPTTRSWRRWRGLAALLVGAIARSSDDFPMPVEHAPSINDDAFLVEVPAVKSTNPIAFGSDDCEIAIDSGGPVEVSRRVLLFNCNV